MARLFFTMQLSLEALLEQYQAIQQLLLVKLQGKRFSHVQPFWADSQASYYNKRGGRRPFTFKNVIDLLRGLHMEDELAVVLLLADCRAYIWKQLQAMPPGMIKSLPIDEPLITQLLLVRVREETSWELGDLQFLLLVLTQLQGQVQYLLDLPSHLIKHQSKPSM